MAETKYLVFSLNERKYCMQLTRINGIECVYNIVPVPLGAVCIKGIIHLRDTVIPVYSLKTLFRMEELPGPNPQLLITETHGLKMAFEVDDVLGIVAVPETEIKTVPLVVESEDTGYLENVVNIKLPEAQSAEIMISISVDNIMSDTEFDKMAEALEQTQVESDE